MYGQMAHDPLIQIQCFVQYAFPLANFLKYFVRKNWQGGDELLLRNGTLDNYAY